MTAAKKDTTAGFQPRIRLGEGIARPSWNALRMDGLLETRVLSPQIHSIILGMARLRNAVSSLKMEGEPIEIDRAREVMDGRAPATPAEEGFRRLARAYGDLSKGRPLILTVKNLLTLHQELFEGVLEEGKVAGELKRTQNYIVRVAGSGLKFQPTPPERTQAELEALFQWYAQEKFTYPPSVTAALFFAEFQAIHPFDDGNGRLGRYLNLAVLEDLGCLRASLTPLDMRLFRTSEKYYDLLATTNGGREYGLWTRYFVGEVEHAYEVALRQADLGPLVSQFGRESTRSILRWVLSGDGGWFRRGEFPNPMQYSSPAIWAALGELCQKGVLEARGKAKGRRYRLRTSILAEIYGRELQLS